MKLGTLSQRNYLSEGWFFTIVTLSDGDTPSCLVYRLIIAARLSVGVMHLRVYGI
jgi:hypothetical protein